MTVDPLRFEIIDSVPDVWIHIGMTHVAKLASNCEPEIEFGEFLHRRSFVPAVDYRLHVDRYGRIRAESNDFQTSPPNGRFIPENLDHEASWQSAGGDEIHPNLALKAAKNLQALATCGHLLEVMARWTRFRKYRLSQLIQTIERAISSGQWKMYFDHNLAARGLLLWARPSATTLAQLRLKADTPIHCSELNAGGDLLLMEFCADTSACADELLRDVDGLLDQEDLGFHLALQAKGDGRRDQVFIAREDIPEAGAWLKHQLLASRTHAVAEAGVSRDTVEA